ncbi:MAG: transposase [Euryarchaeota archaeon]|nr:transposase [Euryarchaeota archaeon]
MKELETRPKLKKFAGITSVPSDDELSRFLSQFSDDQFINLVLMVLNTISQSRRRKKAWIVVDSTDIQLDLNWFRGKITKKSLEQREFKWGYSPSKRFYIRYKLTLAIDYHTRKPLAFLIHEGSPHDSRIYEEILEELHRRRIMRKGDTIITDKGYYSYQNYQLSVPGTRSFL